MTILIVPDIFGRTPALNRLSARLADRMPRPEITIIDPYGDGLFFRKEDQAYEHFSTRLGIPAYSQMVRNRLERLAPPALVLGFSAGAAAIWHMSGQGPCPGVSRGIGFYGSQIRHHPDIRPQFPIHLVFPKSESHFNVNELMDKLDGRPGVTVEQAAGGHGFMNEYSRRFDPGLYEFFIRQLPADLSLPQTLKSSP
ncbi:MAG: hypothetical protein HUN04_22075 [Desulfobacter sp.]|nr:MAG: hypothetical protein HUN04_22075 [Desulfobacter sp.]